MFEISGLDKLSRELDEAQKALSALDGDLGTVSFDPNDPASIEAAVQRVELMVDERLASYSSNSIVGPMIIGLKEKYREGIIERAAAARLQEDQD
jgi:predicted sugar kinase